MGTEDSEVVYPMSTIQENIEYHVVYAVIFRATKPGQMINDWDVRAISLATGEVHHVGRDKTYWVHNEPRQIRHLWDKNSFAEVLDIVNPWDYSLTSQGLNAFIYDYTFVPSGEAFEDVQGHPMEGEYRAKMATSELKFI